MKMIRIKKREKENKMTNNCLFCSIADKKINASIVYEDGNVMAFKDIDPKAPIHILVIPKEHISSITKIEKKHSEILINIIEAIKKIVKSESIEESGFRVVVNHGPDSGQAVSHIHFHILGGRKLAWPPG